MKIQIMKICIILFISVSCSLIFRTSDIDLSTLFYIEGSIYYKLLKTHFEGYIWNQSEMDDNDLIIS
jgi:hypothetical protein